MNTEAFKEYLHDQDLAELLVQVGVLEEDEIVNHKIVCPFHDDHSPSMHLYEDSAYCFSCQTQTDIIGLVEKKFNFSFPEALKYLAEQLNVDWDNKQVNNPMHGGVSWKALEDEWKYYKECLQEAVKTNSTLKQMVEDYQPLELGYNPEKNFLVFRYTAKNGRTAGFSNRNLSYNKNIIGSAKWRHSDKNNSNILVCHGLYNMYNGLKAATKNHNMLILVEGPKDCIPFMKTGRDNVVAVSGVTNQKWVDNIPPMNYYILSYDSDNAGIKGMKDLAKTLLDGRVSSDNLAWVDWSDGDNKLDPYDYWAKYHKVPQPKIIFTLFDENELKQLYNTSSAFNQEQIVLYLSQLKGINYEQAKDFLTFKQKVEKKRKIDKPIKYNERLAEMLNIIE